MKHIKTYKIFDGYILKPGVYSYSISDFIEEINDICLELEDEGYTATIYTEKEYPYFDGIIIMASKSHQPDYFNFDKVKEVFDRLDRYMKSNGFKSRLELYQNQGVHTPLTSANMGRWVGFNSSLSNGYRIKFWKDLR